MYEDLRKAVALLKYYCCISHYCRDCPLDHVVCYGISAASPCGYSLDIFDRNVKVIEKEKMRTAVKELESEVTLMKNNNDLDCIRLLKAVVEIKELCHNRKSCKGCIFDRDAVGIFSNCALAACPQSWDINSIQEFLNTHEE